jgi:hypothetical protein
MKLWLGPHSRRPEIVVLHELGSITKVTNTCNWWVDQVLGRLVAFSTQKVDRWKFWV